MKYTIHGEVSRFVKRLGMVMDPITMNKARDEVKEYDFRKISEGHYAVIHEKEMYVIIDKEGELGCSCDDMTYSRMDGSVCKHVIAFSRLLSPVTLGIDKLDEEHLVHVCGWTGKELHPGPVTSEDATPPPKGTIPPDPELDLGVDDPLPEPETNSTDEPHGDHESDRPEEPTQTAEEKKMSEDKPAWDQEAWDAATQGSFASYGDDGVAMVLFTANDFEVGAVDKWGRNPCEFSVIQNSKSVVLSVGSIRLMQALKEILPLEGKQVRISRSGEGTGMKYSVEVI